MVVFFFLTSDGEVVSERPPIRPLLVGRPIFLRYADVRDPSRTHMPWRHACGPQACLSRRKSPKRRPSCEGLPCFQMRFPSDERLLAGFVVLVLFLRRIVFLVHLEDTWIGLVPVIYRGALDWPQDEEGLPANVCSGDGRRFRSRLVLGPRRVGLTSAAMTGTEPEPCRQPEDLERN